MILVTGATGTIGKEMVCQLLSAHLPFRALARDESVARAKLGEEVEIAVGDFNDSASLSEACAGAEKLFLLCGAQPGMDELEINVLKAAGRAGLKRAVKISVPHAHVNGDAALQRLHGRSEEALRESGLAWTVLRPNAFMQNLLGPTQGFSADGTFRLPVADAQYCFIDARDIAAAAIAALTVDGHDGTVYDVTGPEALTYEQVAGRLKRLTGQPFKFVNTSPEASRRQLLDAGVDEWFVDEILVWFTQFRTGRIGGVTDSVEVLTGRRPRTLDDFAQEHIDRFKLQVLA